MNVVDEITRLQAAEREFREMRSREDSGSYCEDASPKYRIQSTLIGMYQALIDTMIRYEREYC